MATDLATQLRVSQLGQAGQGARRRAAMADRLMADATDGAPVFSPMAALAKALTGGLAGFMGGQAAADERTERDAATQGLIAGDEQRREAQRAQVAALDGFTLPDGVQGPQLPPTAPGGRMGALAGMAPDNPFAASRLSFETGERARADAMRQREEEMAFRRQQLAAQNRPAVESFGEPVQTLQGWVRLGSRGTIAPMPGFNPVQQPRAPISVAPGATLLDPVTREPFFSAPPVETAPRSQARLEQDLSVAQAGRPSVEVRSGQTFGEALGRNSAEQLQALQTEARTGADTLQSVARVRQLLGDGAITGTAAEQRLALARLGATIGVVNGRAVTNTEQLVSELANNVLARTSQMSGVLTDRDIQFLREAAAGSITLTADTIRRVAELTELGANRLIDRYNNAVEPLMSSTDVPEVTRRLYAPIQRPGAAPAQGGGWSIRPVQ